MPSPPANHGADLRHTVPSLGESNENVHVDDARVLNSIVSIVYQWSFLYVYESYITVEHASAGMTYRPFALWETLFIYSVTAIVAITLPPTMKRASAISLWFLFSFFFVPALSITLITSVTSSLIYVPGLIALAASFIFCSLVVQRPLRNADAGSLLPDGQFVAWIMLGWLVMTVILIARFRDIMSFAGIDDIYYQRALASELGAVDVMIGYVRTYYNYVICPALLAIGLVMRNRGALALGIIGLVVTYMIEASKISLVIPIIVLIFFLVQSRKVYSTYLYTAGLAVVTWAGGFLTNFFAVDKFIVDVLIYRSIAIPGQSFVQYYDLFSTSGYTWWSNVSGLHWIIPAPAAFALDPEWPNLGLIVGREYFGWATGVNASANLFSGEGIAAGGPFGVLVIGAALALWLRLFDSIARPWNPLFVALAMVPVAIALSSAHLSTMLLSFGGAFWALALRFYRPDAKGSSADVIQ